MAAKVIELKIAGNKAFQAGDFHKAVAAFGEAIALDDTNAVLFSNRSAAFNALAYYQAAHADAVKTVALRPEWAKAYCRLGSALHGMGKLEASLQAYADGLQYEPTNSACKEGIASVKKQQDKKATILKEAVRNPPPPATAATTPGRIPSAPCYLRGAQIVAATLQQLHRELDTGDHVRSATEEPAEFNVPQRLLYFARPLLQGSDVAWLQSSTQTPLLRLLSPFPSSITDPLTSLVSELNFLGYWSGPVNGVLGPQSVRALMEFQRSCHLVQDGVFGPNTLYALRKCLQQQETAFVEDAATRNFAIPRCAVTPPYARGIGCCKCRC